MADFTKDLPRCLTEMYHRFRCQSGCKCRSCIRVLISFLRGSEFGPSILEVVYNGANQAFDIYTTTGLVRLDSEWFRSWRGMEYIANWTLFSTRRFINFYINGINVLTLAAINTTGGAGGGNSSSSFDFQANSGGGANGGSHLDDLYILNPTGAVAPYNAC